MEDEEIQFDEKYISIPYSTWVNKYKVLDEENERLQAELDKQVVDVRIEIEGRKVDTYGEQYGWHRTDVIFAKFSTFNEELREIIKPFEYKQKLIESAIDGSNKVLEEKIIDLRRRVNRIPNFIKWIYGIKKI